MLSKEPIANLMPHYTNPRFRDAQTVWIAKGQKPSGRAGTIQGIVYNYSDRLWQWDWKKCDEAHKSIDPKLDRRSPAFVQEFLRKVLDRPNLKLLHVMAGFNVSNGNPYQVYGYIEAND